MMQYGHYGFYGFAKIGVKTPCKTFVYCVDLTLTGEGVRETGKQRRWRVSPVGGSIMRTSLKGNSQHPTSRTDERVFSVRP